MRAPPSEELEPYLARLGELPFVKDARPAGTEPQTGRLHWDAAIDLRVGNRTRRYLVELKHTPRLDYALVNALRSRVAQTYVEWILFTPFVTTPMAQHLQQLGINFVDLAGNCRLVVDEGHVAMIQGRRPATRTEETRAMGPAGLRVLFALLARPELLQAPVRQIATTAGVGKTAAAVAQTRLIEAGLLGRTRTKTLILRPKAALDRLVAGYRETLRPKLTLGRYQAPDRDPLELEHRIERALELTTTHRAGERWAWGGAAAEYRLTGHYRGEETVLHVDRLALSVPQTLRVLPARAGNLVILGVPAPLAFEGILARTVHPLLVYTELLMHNDDRAGEAAAGILDRFLPHLQ